MKRAMDIFFSLIGLIVLSPIFIAVAIVVKTEDMGPVFFKAVRVGLHGIPFKMYKFRTMVVNADKLGPSSTSLSDKRITETGRFLRKFKIDEIPQLINVLISNMSIVGPRPEIKRFTDIYTEEERAILSVKPGITDWASIWNSDEGRILEGSIDPDRTYFELIRPEKIRMQLVYVKNHNFFIDLRIIFFTIKKIISGK
jgi:lipopolysaccharide/colanic/teichoic acid biosynthesis glycosyltransferase